MIWYCMLSMCQCYYQFLMAGRMTWELECGEQKVEGELLTWSYCWHWPTLRTVPHGPHAGHAPVSPLSMVGADYGPVMSGAEWSRQSSQSRRRTDWSWQGSLGIAAMDTCHRHNAFKCHVSPSDCPACCHSIQTQPSLRSCQTHLAENIWRSSSSAGSWDGEAGHWVECRQTGAGCISEYCSWLCPDPLHSLRMSECCVSVSSALKQRKPQHHKKSLKDYDQQPTQQLTKANDLKAVAPHLIRYHLLPLLTIWTQEGRWCCWWCASGCHRCTSQTSSGALSPETSRSPCQRRCSAHSSSSPLLTRTSLRPSHCSPLSSCRSGGWSSLRMSPRTCCGSQTGQLRSHCLSSWSGGISLERRSGDGRNLTLSFLQANDPWNV